MASLLVDVQSNLPLLCSGALRTINHLQPLHVAQSKNHIQNSMLLLSLWRCALLSCAFLLISSLHDSLHIQLANHVGINTIILPVNALGLANRMRLIASAYSIALRMNKSLVVIWQANEDCMASFYELFDEASDISVLIMEPGMDNSVFSRTVREALNFVGSVKNLSIQEHYPRDFYVSIGDVSPHGIHILWTRGTHASVDSECTDYLADKQQFYRLLRPTAAVTELIDSVDIQSDDELVVGVHIRAFDARYDWAVVSPSLASVREKGGESSQHPHPAAASSSARNELDSNATDSPSMKPLHLQSKRFDQAASLEAFVGVMEDLIQTHPAVRFFLASNSAQAKRNLVQHFGASRVLTLQDEAQLGERESVHSLVVALAEFYLLGATSFVVHTRGSSFAREAAARSGIPVVDVSVHFLVFMLLLIFS